MLEPNELAISRLIELCANQSDNYLASQIVSIAISLSNKPDKHFIISKMDLAVELIATAKKNHLKKLA